MVARAACTVLPSLMGIMMVSKTLKACHGGWGGGCLGCREDQLTATLNGLGPGEGWCT